MNTNKVDIMLFIAIVWIVQFSYMEVASAVGKQG